MFRTIKTALALAALLAIAACNSITDPVVDDQTQTAERGGLRFPQEFVPMGDEFTPDEGGGGSGAIRPEPQRRRGNRGSRRHNEELAPATEHGGGGSGAIGDPEPPTDTQLQHGGGGEVAP
ncbi:MAG: hypothetical protein ACE5G2_01855 [Candidatus Krumholzibacteriia bacterium]